MTSSTSVGLHFGRKEMVILGTQYAGEMKKGVLTIMMYLMPKLGALPLHSSANEVYFVLLEGVIVANLIKFRDKEETLHFSLDFLEQERLHYPQILSVH